MTDTVKITALSPIGSNIAGNTLVPVVDMTGTPTTKKATISNIGNVILSQNGNITTSLVKSSNTANLTLSSGGTNDIIINVGGSNMAKFSYGNNAFEVGTVRTYTANYANLPSPQAGLRAFISNANLTPVGNFGAQVSGGGGNSTPVWCDGSVWRIG